MRADKSANANSSTSQRMYPNVPAGQVPAEWKGKEAIYHRLFDKGFAPKDPGYNYNLHDKRLRKEKRKRARAMRLQRLLHPPTPPPTPLPEGSHGVIGVDPVATNSLFSSLFKQQKTGVAPKSSKAPAGKITCPHITCKFKELKSGRKVVLVKTHHSNDMHLYHHHCNGGAHHSDSCNCVCWDKKT
jgi:hypothetical protein